MKTIMLRIRVEPEFKQKLEEAVRSGKAESMSELIRKAVLKLLETQTQAG
ncbi:MAG: ribbon-helix-helix protein, CopG family [Candidatus Bathyarchaeia archaeon]